ncbi:MAG: hypothetical protein HZB98_06930 [Bacteroidia bacterium]|nr:hypothetical protein [Bacteroidia bacterium]
MKRIPILLLIFFCTTFLALSQKVDSIKVEQSGDFIKIRYKILNSEPDQIYRVRVLCSINGGLNQEIKTVTGDVGDQVMGGKSEYWVVWDVLKDVEELTSAEFVVRAELVNKDITSSKSKKNNKSNSIQPVLQLPGPGIGLRYGFMGKAGVSFQYAVFFSKQNQGYTGDDIMHRFSLDLTARLSNKDNFQTHLLFGPTVSHSIIMETNNGYKDFNKHFTPGFEAGVVFCMKRTVFSIVGSRLFPGMTEEGEAISQTKFLTAGFGFRF